MDIPALFRERTGLDLREFTGAAVTAEIPISDELVNRTIAGRLADHPHVTGIRVQAQDGDTCDVQVVPRARILPPIRIVARIERQPQLPEHPVLLLRWSMPAAGALAMFAAPALSFFKAMPPGIQMDRDHIAVDIQQLLTARGMGDALTFVRRLEVHTRAGGFVARVDLAI